MYNLQLLTYIFKKKKLILITNCKLHPVKKIGIDLINKSLYHIRKSSERGKKKTFDIEQPYSNSPVRN